MPWKWACATSVYESAHRRLGRLANIVCLKIIYRTQETQPARTGMDSDWPDKSAFDSSRLNSTGEMPDDEINCFLTAKEVYSQQAIVRAVRSLNMK